MSQKTTTHKHYSDLHNNLNIGRWEGRSSVNITLTELLHLDTMKAERDFTLANNGLLFLSQENDALYISSFFFFEHL